MAYCRNAFPLVRKAFGAVERIGSKSGEAISLPRAFDS